MERMLLEKAIVACGAARNNAVRDRLTWHDLQSPLVMNIAAEPSGRYGIRVEAVFAIDCRHSVAQLATFSYHLEYRCTAGVRWEHPEVILQFGTTILEIWKYRALNWGLGHAVGVCGTAMHR